MNKLTAKEIIEILKKHTTVSNFCQEDCFLEIPKDFKFSEEVKAKEEAYLKADKEWIEHGKSYNNDDKYYQNKIRNPFPFEAQHKDYLNFLGLGEVEETDSYGGEDCGSTYYSVKHFKDHGVYLKVSGWYQSHYGTDFGDWDDAVKEVSPKQKTITVFE